VPEPETHLSADKAYWITSILTSIEFNADTAECTTTLCNGECHTCDMTSPDDATKKRTFHNRLLAQIEACNQAEEHLLDEYGPDVTEDAFALARPVKHKRRVDPLPLSTNNEPALDLIHDAQNALRSELVTLFARYVLPDLKESRESPRRLDTGT
jgi:hypothetical protein